MPPVDNYGIYRLRPGVAAIAQKEPVPGHSGCLLLGRPCECYQIPAIRPHINDYFWWASTGSEGPDDHIRRQPPAATKLAIEMLIEIRVIRGAEGIEERCETPYNSEEQTAELRPIHLQHPPGSDPQPEAGPQGHEVPAPGPRIPLSGPSLPEDIIAPDRSFSATSRTSGSEQPRSRKSRACRPHFTRKRTQNVIREQRPEPPGAPSPSPAGR